MYEYTAVVVKVVDGDTIKLDVDLGFSLWRKNDNFRLIGIDAPELRGDEREKGLKCKEFVEKYLPVGQKVLIETTKPDKYGRWLANILVEVNNRPANIAQLLINEGYAKPYLGKGQVSFPKDEPYPLLKEGK